MPGTKIKAWCNRRPKVFQPSHDAGTLLSLHVSWEWLRPGAILCLEGQILFDGPQRFFSTLSFTHGDWINRSSTNLLCPRAPKCLQMFFSIWNRGILTNTDRPTHPAQHVLLWF